MIRVVVNSTPLIALSITGRLPLLKALFDDEKEWRDRVVGRHSFVMDVLAHEKVFLSGAENDLSALGAGGVD